MKDIAKQAIKNQIGSKTDEECEELRVEDFSSDEENETNEMNAKNKETCVAAT